MSESRQEDLEFVRETTRLSRVVFVVVILGPPLAFIAMAFGAPVFIALDHFTDIPTYILGWTVLGGAALAVYTYEYIKLFVWVDPDEWDDVGRLLGGESDE